MKQRRSNRRLSYGKPSNRGGWRNGGRSSGVSTRTRAQRIKSRNATAKTLVQASLPADVCVDDGAESCRHKAETVCSLTAGDVWLGGAVAEGASAIFVVSDGETESAEARMRVLEQAGRSKFDSSYRNAMSDRPALCTDPSGLTSDEAVDRFLLARAQDGEGQRNTTPVEFYVPAVQRRKEFSTARPSRGSRTRAAMTAKASERDQTHKKSRASIQSVHEGD